MILVHKILLLVEYVLLEDRVCILCRRQDVMRTAIQRSSFCDCFTGCSLLPLLCHAHTSFWHFDVFIVDLSLGLFWSGLPLLPSTWPLVVARRGCHLVLVLDDDAHWLVQACFLLAHQETQLCNSGPYSLKIQEIRKLNKGLILETVSRQCHCRYRNPKIYIIPLTTRSICTRVVVGLERRYLALFIACWRHLLK